MLRGEKGICGQSRSKGEEVQWDHAPDVLRELYVLIPRSLAACGAVSLLSRAVIVPQRQCVRAFTVKLYFLGVDIKKKKFVLCALNTVLVYANIKKHAAYGRMIHMFVSLLSPPPSSPDITAPVDWT